jgi:hypothetical protein
MNAWLKFVTFVIAFAVIGAIPLSIILQNIVPHDSYSTEFPVQVALVMGIAVAWGMYGLPRSAARPGPLATTKACPRCAEDVKAAALVCRFCQHEFAFLAAPPPVKPAARPLRAARNDTWKQARAMWDDAVAPAEVDPSLGKPYLAHQGGADKG